MKVKVRRAEEHEPHVKGATLRDIKVGEGLPDLTTLRAEFQEMWDVLLGRKEPPIQQGAITLMEVADAYFARASEVHALIRRAENDGTVLKNSGHYKFRTSEVRDFLEMAKRASDLGSRRVTFKRLELEHQEALEE